MADTGVDGDASADGDTEVREHSEDGDVYTDPNESGRWSGKGPGILYKLLIESR